MPILDKIREKTGLTASSAGNPPVNGAEQSAAPNPESSGSADRLLAAHAEATQNPVKRGRGRPPGSKSHAQSSAPPSASAAPPAFLPPQTSLSQVMGAGTGTFYALLASLYDDENWLVSDTIKKEMGDILSWMLADDFYKMGGVGKYVTGTFLFMGVLAIQAQKTAPTRRARRLEAQARRNRQQSQPGPANAPQPNPIQGGVNHEQTMERGTLEGFMVPPSPKQNPGQS